MSYKLGANPCPKCRENGSDAKGDNFHFYGEGRGGFCFKCGYTELSDDEKSRRSEENFQWTKEMEEEVTTQEKLTEEQIIQIKGYTGEKANNLRGISDKTYRAYGVRHKYKEETGEPVEQYYPITEGYAASGYKLRILPKSFSRVGKVGKQSDLFGQWKWKTASGKFVVLTSGEIDCLSAYQMLEEYRLGKNSDFEPIPVVSSIIGETGSYGQCALHYDWFDRFERVIVIYDQDKAGQDALKDLVKVLPKGKMFTVDLPMKDCNEMLSAGKQKAFIDCFWKAKPYNPEGITGSSSFMDAVIKEAHAPRIEFPPFMKQFNEMTAGGPALGTIGLLSAFTGAAKSTIVNECCYHWLFHGQLKIGVISMEQNLGQYSELVLSRHINIKLNAMPQKEKIELLEKDWVKEKAEELFKDEKGLDRWYVIDDRDCHINVMKKRIEQLIVQCGCQLIVWDTISDSFDMLTIDEQAQVMMWMKGMVTQHPVSFILIAHQRKVGSGEKDGSQGGVGTESGVQGTSTLVKSAAWVIIASRDKMNDDEIVRNTTNLFMPKNRGAGYTGECGKLYYENSTHMLYDFDDWIKSREVSF